MENTNKQEHIFKESGPFLTNEEFLEMDGILLKTSEDVITKISEISGILGKSDSAIRILREAYLSAKAIVKEKDAVLEEKKHALEEEKNSRQILLNEYALLQQQGKKWEEETDRLKEKLEGADQEKRELLGRVQKLEEAFFTQKERYQTLEAESKRIQEDYSRHYTDARADKERAESELRQWQDDLAKEKENVIRLQRCLSEETEKREDKEREAGELNRQLFENMEKVRALDEKVRQYGLQEQKMPLLMRLYHAYNRMMEKKEELPQEFLKRLQSVVPMNNFDGFLFRALKRSFPIYFYGSIQAFLTICSHSRTVSKEAMKEALYSSDALLSAVFDLGSEYFKEEKLVRINLEAGNSFDGDLCRYIDEKGGLYGDIVKVWLHGFRDEKNNKIYCSYVEGE